MSNLVERLKFNGFSGTENVLHRTRRWTVERNEAAARIAELEAALMLWEVYMDNDQATLECELAMASHATSEALKDTQ
jgi:hypothetical protein